MPIFVNDRITVTNSAFTVYKAVAPFMHPSHIILPIKMHVDHYLQWRSEWEEKLQNRSHFIRIPL